MVLLLTPRSARRVPQTHREYSSETVFEPETRSLRPARWSSARWGEERRKFSHAPGVLLFGDFLLDKQENVTRGAGAEPPAIMLLRSRARRANHSRPGPRLSPGWRR